MTPRNSEGTSLFVLVGDTQRTLGVERIIGREQNDIERIRILGAAARERTGVFFFLGDMVALGSSKGDWRYFDQISAGIFRSGAKVFGLYGNHDYFGGRRAGERQMLARFPNLASAKWGRYENAGVRLIYLDSNHGVLSGEEWEAQRSWFAAELSEADADPGVLGVLVLIHHPPYTNSKVTGDALIVKRDVVPLFLAARKTMAMISGHCHTYEKFSEDGRLFMVSGGGGGPRIRLLVGAVARHADLYAGEAPRPFHYVRVENREDGLDLVAIGFSESGEAPVEFDRTSLRFR